MNNDEITYEQVLEYCKKRNYTLVTREFYFYMIGKVRGISIEWIEKKLFEYVCNRKYSSDSLQVVYSLISDWRKENG